jgi:hypothetical protein
MDLSLLIIVVLAAAAVFIVGRILLPVDSESLTTGQADKIFQSATALVTNIIVTGHHYGTTGLLLEVEVFPPKQQPFKAELHEEFPAQQAAKLVPGVMIEVKYNPANHSKVLFVKFVHSNNIYSTL